jgi:serine/threonine protein kinase
MELLQGESLDDRLKREGRLPLADVLRIGREVAEALAEAHERGLIHRDIKPANLWLEGKRQRVKVLDFGLARATGEDPHLT